MLNALVSSEQIRFKQTSETVCTDGWVLDEIRERFPDWGQQSIVDKIPSREQVSLRTKIGVEKLTIATVLGVKQKVTPPAYMIYAPVFS